MAKTTSPIPPDALRVLERLVAHLDSGVVRAGRPETYIGYKKVHDDLKLKLIGATYGESLNKQGLGSLAHWTDANGMPSITGLVVDTTKWVPGPGYFEFFNPEGDPYAWWESEIEQVARFEWHPFIPELAPPPTPTPPDKADPPKKFKATIYRILRDTELARRMKRTCGYKCQLCGHSILLPDGSLYVEAHHVVPLGSPHNGDDMEHNLLIVCPNHHAALDYGAIKLSRNSITGPCRTTLAQDAIDYHNKKIASP